MKNNRLMHLAPPTILMRIVAIALACVWLGLGIVEQISPEGFTSMYGLEIAGEAGLTYVRGIGARNIALASSIIAVSIIGIRAAMIILAFSLSLMSAIEFFITLSVAGPMAGIRFVVFTIVLALIAVWYLVYPRAQE